MLEDLLSLPIDALARILPQGTADALLRLSLRDRVFLLVAAAVLVLVVLSLLFSALTLLYRLRVERREEQIARIASTHEGDLLAVLAGDLEPERLIRKVRAKDRIEFVAWLMTFAERVRGEELERIRRLAAPHLHLIADRLFVPSPERRARCVLLLGKLGFDEHEEEIVRALDDPTPMVSLLAAEALAAKGGTRYAGAILDRLHRFDLWSPAYLSEMLSSMGPEVVPELRAVYEDPDALPTVRAIAADALGLVGAPESAEIAYGVLRSFVEGKADPEDPAGHRELILASLRVLQQFGHADHADLPRDLLVHPDPVIRALAASVIGAVGTDRDIPLLVTAVSDDVRWVALHAAHGLKALRAIDTLEKLVSNDDPRSELFREVLEE